MVESSPHRPALSERIAWWLVTTAMLAGGSAMFAAGNLAKGAIGVLAAAVLLGAALWQRRSRHRLPSLFVALIYVYIFVAVGLGTIGGAYGLPHFDDALHLTSGVGTGYGAWLILRRAVRHEVVAQLSDSFVALYMLSFVLAAAGIWELWEFAGDQWFHLTTGRGHADTMFDMLDGLVGGIVVCWIILKRRQRL